MCTMWVIRDVYWSRIDASPICASLLHGILQVASVRICVHVCEFARMRIKFCTFLSKNTEPYCFHYEKWSHALCIHWICPCRDSRGCCDFNVYTDSYTNNIQPFVGSLDDDIVGLFFMAIQVIDMYSLF